MKPPDHRTPSLAFVGSDLADNELELLRRLLLEERGLDLGSYKEGCIKRRIAIRVRARGCSAFAAYLELLRRERGEMDRLLATLSIHVSHFFRNPSTFTALRQHLLPELLHQFAQQNRPLRIWSAGCASGEEPYSLALLLAELHLPRQGVSLLATDLSPDVLALARAALYDRARLAEVQAPLLQRFFSTEGDKYRLREEIRRMVVFRQHDLLREAPFPAAELILCRNAMIYFSRAEQEKILARFAAALPEHGFLVLGRSEALVGAGRNFFQVESAAERIYRRNNVSPFLQELEPGPYGE
jgi:chemotaxis protein methyltransferase CheR